MYFMLIWTKSTVYLFNSQIVQITTYIFLLKRKSVQHIIKSHYLRKTSLHVVDRMETHLSCDNLQCRISSTLQEAKSEFILGQHTIWITPHQRVVILTNTSLYVCLYSTPDAFNWVQHVAVRGEATNVKPSKSCSVINSSHRV
ncbi:hypothetical protein C0J52_26541 [Blattella germanica]|nr:hypothetical protein C0J52_26541 [Blattella germanica]